MSPFDGQARHRTRETRERDARSLAYVRLASNSNSSRPRASASESIASCAFARRRARSALSPPPCLTRALALRTSARSRGRAGPPRATRERRVRTNARVTRALDGSIARRYAKTERIRSRRRSLVALERPRGASVASAARSLAVRELGDRICIAHGEHDRGFVAGKCTHGRRLDRSRAGGRLLQPRSANARTRNDRVRVFSLVGGKVLRAHVKIKNSRARAECGMGDL